MAYKPTLGGLKKAQKFLEENGFPMPCFYVNIYGDGNIFGVKSNFSELILVLIDEQIDKYGHMFEVVNVRIANEKGDLFIQFSSPFRKGIFTGNDIIDDGLSVEIESSINPDLLDFMQSSNALSFLYIARWGKQKVYFWDRLLFYFFPSLYAKMVFSD